MRLPLTFGRFVRTIFYCLCAGDDKWQKRGKGKPQMGDGYHCTVLGAGHKDAVTSGSEV